MLSDILSAHFHQERKHTLAALDGREGWDLNRLRGRQTTSRPRIHPSLQSNDIADRSPVWVRRRRATNSVEAQCQALPRVTNSDKVPQLRPEAATVDPVSRPPARYERPHFSRSV